MTLKERAAIISIIATVVITLAKGITGWFTGSLALISDAAHSLLDVGATTITFFAVRAADRPADDEHPYGHGKVESIAALGETVFLIALSAIVAYEGVRRLISGETHVETSLVAFAVLFAAILVDAWRWYSLNKAAKETGSEALAADALHFSSDLVNSVLVIVALIAAHFGYPQFDPLVAVGVAIFIAVAGWRLGRRTIDSLMDAAPKGAGEKVSAAVAGVPGVVALDGVRLRPSGGAILGEIGIRVSRTHTLERVADIKADVEKAVAEASPGASVTVTANPIAMDDESVLERIMLIAARKRVPIHHITVQHLQGNLSVSCDVEVDGRLSIGAAHRKASQMEDALRAEFGNDTEVESHIEPLEIGEWAGEDASTDIIASITTALTAHARATSHISDIHNVRVRTTPAGLIVNYHCRTDPKIDVATAHADVDAIERALRKNNSTIRRVVGHCEPLRAAD
ncbi:MAG: cation diffusion facilitator family transporter [Beijerinckiaceae bacterium]